MMLLLCLSPMPRMNVATQYPAQERVNRSIAWSYLEANGKTHTILTELTLNKEKKPASKRKSNRMQLLVKVFPLTSPPCSCP